MTTAPIRVLLVEDHQMVREGLRALLDGVDDLRVLGEASDGAVAVQIAEDRGPDVVVMDISLPGLNGIDATARLQRRRPDIPVVILSMHDDASTVDRALRAGARGYVLKGGGIECLCEAIRAVAQGQVYLSAGVSEYVLQGYLNTDDVRTDPLSDREREILQLMAEGYTSREIAERVGLKPKTVQNHRANIMEKLDIRTTAGLVRYALSTGLVH